MPRGNRGVRIVLLWLLPIAEEKKNAAFAALDPAEQLEAITGLSLRDLVTRIQVFTTSLAITAPHRRGPDAQPRPDALAFGSWLPTPPAPSPIR